MKSKGNNEQVFRSLDEVRRALFGSEQESMPEKGGDQGANFGKELAEELLRDLDQSLSSLQLTR